MLAKALKVLVVDDDDVTLEVVKERLERAGHQVECQQTAFGSAASINRILPDVVLVDINMPGLSGDMLVKVLNHRDLLAHPVLILHSAETEEKLASVAAACGAYGYIKKTSDEGFFVAQFHAIVRAPRVRAAP